MSMAPEKHIPGEEQSQFESLSTLWLADLRALPDFTPRDESILQRIAKSDKDSSMFASQQLRRQQILEESGGTHDIIQHQLHTLRQIFS